MTKEQIEAAVDWWANAIQNPIFDAGADSPQMDLAQILMEMTSDGYPPTDEQVEAFKARLALLIEEDHGSLVTLCGLSVDYDPDPRLRVACTVSGVNTARLPIKTRMRFEGGHVDVSCGYGKPPVRLI